MVDLTVDVGALDDVRGLTVTVSGLECADVAAGRDLVDVCRDLGGSGSGSWDGIVDLPRAGRDGFDALEVDFFCGGGRDLIQLVRVTRDATGKPRSRICTSFKE